MLRFQADATLSALIRRYYRGEAALWAEIRARVEQELHQRALGGRGYHMRLLRRADDSYDVLIESADAYVEDS